MTEQALWSPCRRSDKQQLMIVPQDGGKEGTEKLACNQCTQTFSLWKVLWTVMARQPNDL